MKIKYFQDTDTLYIEFRPAEVAETRDLDENTILDIDRIKFTEGAIDGHGGLRRLTEVTLWLNFKPWHHWNGRRRLAIERSANALAEWEVRTGHFRMFLPKRVLDSVDPHPLAI